MLSGLAVGGALDDEPGLALGATVTDAGVALGASEVVAVGAREGTAEGGETHDQSDLLRGVFTGSSHGAKGLVHAVPAPLSAQVEHTVVHSSRTHAATPRIVSLPVAGAMHVHAHPAAPLSLHNCAASEHVFIAAASQLPNAGHEATTALICVVFPSGQTQSQLSIDVVDRSLHVCPALVHTVPFLGSLHSSSLHDATIAPLLVPVAGGVHAHSQSLSEPTDF